MGRQEIRTKRLFGRALKQSAMGICDAAWSVQSKDVSAALPKRRGEVLTRASLGSGTNTGRHPRAKALITFMQLP